QPKYGVGSGLSGRRYIRTVNKNTNATVFVSFVGAPRITKEEEAELVVHPKFIAEARNVEHLPRLFQKRLIDVAVVSRFQFPAPGPENPKSPNEWFTKRYQIIMATNLPSLPKSESE